MNAPLAVPELDRLFADLRPKLHRYCARMTGSVIDGEDVVQAALMKAVEALPRTDSLAQPEAWLFRIAHNAALDFIRVRGRKEHVLSDIDPESVDDPVDPIEDRQDVAFGLHRLMQLPAAQRSAVILMDVLGYSLQEIAEIMASTIPAVKAALHRGRGRLRRLAEAPDDTPVPALAAAQRSLLLQYIDRFNARDFDAIRDLLANEVQLDLVARSRLEGRKDVSVYFTNYAKIPDWRVVAGTVEGRPAALVHLSDGTSEGLADQPAYFVLLEWADGQLVHIRDFHFARYAVADAVMVPAG
jgi:RNA polymerase sigma-70 factor (ECF subfamily)